MISRVFSYLGLSGSDKVGSFSIDDQFDRLNPSTGFTMHGGVDVGGSLYAEDTSPDDQTEKLFRE
jgi:hypothetical protein